MKRYRVTGTETRYLEEKIIESKSHDKAMEKAYKIHEDDFWEETDTITEFKIEEIKNKIGFKTK
jgi:hypothetical protein